MSLGVENMGQRLDTDGPGEFRCDKCRARCTQSPSNDGVEYGHMSGCPERPDEWPSGGKYLSNADHAPAGGETVVVTDGGTFDCEGCGETTAVSKRRRYMHPGQSDVGPVQYDDLCPQCSAGKPSERLFRAAADQGGEAGAE